MSEASDLERDLQALGAEMRKLEGDYNLFFAGRLPRPPWEGRTRFEAMLKRLDRVYIDNTTARFRMQQLQARYATLADLWDRGLRAREEGRPGPFAKRPPHDEGTERHAAAQPERVVHVASFVDPLAERDKLESLDESLSEARRETGETPVPFHRFADLVREQVQQLRAQGTPEVALRIAVKDGHVLLTARGLKGLTA